MLKQLTIMSFLLLGLTACGGSSNSNQATPGPQPEIPAPDPVFANVRSAAQGEMRSNESAAVSIAIYKDGEIVYAEAFGNTQKDKATPVTIDTLFQLGSTTKMFTSLATMQLVERGVITTDDKLTMALPGINYLPEQSQGWQNINIHHMMTHQGGFTDDYQTLSESDELLNFMQNKYGGANPQMVEPGRFYNYSNPNFSYLGAIIESLGQQDYREIMAQSVFEPLGMARTTMLKSQVIEDGDFALGVYQADNGASIGYSNINQVNDFLPAVPAGSYTWSTPTELIKMADFLLSGNSDILADDLRSEMTKAHVSLNLAGLPLNYGYGIYIDDGFVFQNRWYPEKLWQHGGNTLGYTSKFWVLPEKNIAVAILSSGNGDDYENTMLEAIKSVTELPTSEAIPFGEVDTASFEQHVGTYDAGFITIEISNNDGVLEVNVPEFNAEGVSYSRVLDPLGGNTFLANQESEELDVTFFPQEQNGQSVYIRNQEFVGILAGQQLSAKPRVARELLKADTASKVILH
jgi:CubicO group peptidase (beta-lactamase class C family)